VPGAGRELGAVAWATGGVEVQVDVGTLNSVDVGDGAEALEGDVEHVGVLGVDRDPTELLHSLKAVGHHVGDKDVLHAVGLEVAQHTEADRSGAQDDGEHAGLGLGGVDALVGHGERFDLLSRRVAGSSSHREEGARRKERLIS